MSILSHIFVVLCLVLQVPVDESVDLVLDSAVSAPQYEVVVLGRAQDGGMPHVGCERPCCVEARITGRRELPASLGIIDRASGKLLLIEATPSH